MKTKKILLSFLCMISICSCQNEEGIFENTTYQSNAKLKRILSSFINSKAPMNIIAEYEYDKENRITKISSPMYEEGEITGTISYDIYNYNSQGQLIKIENFNANINSPTGFINLRNYTYTYLDDGQKEKEYIEYPIIDSFEYSLYKYEKGRLSKVEKYDNSGNLDVYIINEYDSSGNLTKETSYGNDNQPYSYTQHSYNNGLNTQSDIFSGKDMKEHLRTIIKTYDKNNNLIFLESKELSIYSSAMSYVLKYEYFEE